MTRNERIFHAVLFEMIALAIIIPAASLITGKGSSDLAVVGIGLSLYTVVWNYIYNLYFDKWFDLKPRRAQSSDAHWSHFGV